MTKQTETKQQSYRRRLRELGLKKLEVWIHKDDKAAEKAVRAFDRRGEVVR